MNWRTLKPVLVWLPVALVVARADVFVSSAPPEVDSRGQAGEKAAKLFGADQFEELRAIIKPDRGEADWEQVPWMPSTDIWAARQKAAKEGKPLFLWYMAGEPLGPC